MITAANASFLKCFYNEKETRQKYKTKQGGSQTATDIRKQKIEDLRNWKKKKGKVKLPNFQTDIHSKYFA